MLSLLMVVAAAAQTSAVSFSIENNSEQTIDAILYGRSSSEEWSDNILDVQVEPGDTVQITVDNDLEDCMYDFAYSFDYRVGLCRARRHVRD